MELAVRRERIHPTVAAAEAARIVRPNYCRTKALNTADLRLLPTAHGNWTFNVTYRTSMECHGDLEDDAIRQRTCAAATNRPHTHRDEIPSWAETHSPIPPHKITNFFVNEAIA